MEKKTVSELREATNKAINDLEDLFESKWDSIFEVLMKSAREGYNHAELSIPQLGKFLGIKQMDVQTRIDLFTGFLEEKGLEVSLGSICDIPSIIVKW